MSVPIVNYKIQVKRNYGATIFRYYKTAPRDTDSSEKDTHKASSVVN